MWSPRRPSTSNPWVEACARNHQTINAYDASPDVYEANTAIDSSEHHAARAWIDYTLTALRERYELADLPVLELGSGTGRDADYLEAHGLTVRRTDATPAFVQTQHSKGNNAEVLNALTDELGGPYSMIFANGVFPHFSDPQARFVIDKAFASLAPDGLLVFSLKTTDVMRHWDQNTIEGWDIAIPPNQYDVPRKLNAERYYYVRHPIDARLLADHGGLERTTAFMPYNTERSQWLGIVVCKDGFGELPSNTIRHYLPHAPSTEQR